MAASGQLEPQEASTRACAGSLAQLLVADHWVILREGRSRFEQSQKRASKRIWPAVRETLTRGLKDKADMVHEEWISQDKSKKKTSSALLLGLSFTKAPPVQGLSVILGPMAGPKSAEAESFRQFWGGEEACDLRRFEDGSIRESVALHNPWGTVYICLAIIQHLLRVHHKDEAAVEPLLFPASVLPRSFLTLENVRRIRGVLDAFGRLLMEISDPAKPIRKVRGLSSVLHFGGALDTFQAPEKRGKKIVKAENGVLLLREGANLAPSLTRAIAVTLDITHKKNMNREMFDHMSLAFLIELKRKLDGRGSSTMLKSSRLYVEHDTFLFAVAVEPLPPKHDSDADDVDADQPEEKEVLSPGAIHSYIQSVGLRHAAWPGTFYLAQNWLQQRMLSSVVDERVLELLLAHVFTSPVERLKSPETVESAFLRFLDLVSFHEFAAKPLFLNEDDLIPASVRARVLQAMSEQRAAMPAATIVTPYDGANTPSRFTKSLLKPNLERLVNWARQSLFSLLNSREEMPVDFSAYGKSSHPDLSAYDFLIWLKPLQVPKARVQGKENSSEGKTRDAKSTPRRDFPVVDFNPVESYLEELQVCFANMARFYYGFGGHVIGVKLTAAALKQLPSPGMRHIGGKCSKDDAFVADLNAMLEDFSILGQGLVKNIESNVKGVLGCTAKRDS